MAVVSDPDGTPTLQPVAAGRTRDRHGRGLRSSLVRRSVDVAGQRVDVPVAATPAQRFDELVLDAVEHLERRWARELEQVEFAVEDVPNVPTDTDPGLDPDVVCDDTAGGAVPLGTVLLAGGNGGSGSGSGSGDGVGGGGAAGVEDAGGSRVAPRIVVYRRPLEARADSRVELAELVLDVVVDLVARLLGKDSDEVDPPRD